MQTLTRTHHRRSGVPAPHRPVAILHLPRLAAALLAVALVGLPGGAAADTPIDDLELGRSALAVGDLVGARAAFERAARRRTSRMDGTAGLLQVALAEGDRERMTALMQGLKPKKSSEALILAAGAVEVTLRPATDGALAWAEAACALKEPRWAEDVRGLCTMAPLLRTAPAGVRCADGCEEALTLAVSYAGSQPVVMASVNGGDPVPLLVDTGASGCLLTEQAAASLGLARREDTALEISATGGFIPSWRDLVGLGLGGARMEDVEVVVADLPIAGLAGILSPQAVWPDRIVELDFVRHELRVLPSDGRPLAGVELPWRQHEGRPYIELRAGERPAAPVVIDSGASHTHLDEAWEALAPTLERLDVDQALGAGGATSELIRTEGRLEAMAGALPLALESPALYTPHSTSVPGVRNHGLLGADAWMGRVLALDPAGRRLAMTDPPTLTPWQPMAGATFEVFLDGEAAGSFTEVVVARDAEEVTLEVFVLAGDQPVDRFHIRMRDSWTARGTWMLTRPVQEAWTTGEQGVQELSPANVVPRWLPLFRSFGTSGAEMPPELVFGQHDVAGQQLSCTRLTVGAVAGDDPATLSILECPALPWRTVELRLVRSADGAELWRVRLVEDR